MGATGWGTKVAREMRVRDEGLREEGMRGSRDYCKYQ